MRYYEHYLKKLKESFQGAPYAREKTAILDALERFPLKQRFLMIQDIERLVGDVDPELVDWVRGVDLVREAAAESSDAASFCQRLRKSVSAALVYDA